MRDLIIFFKKLENRFSNCCDNFEKLLDEKWKNNSDELCINLNKAIARFIELVISYIAKELCGEKRLIGLDEKYFSKKSSSEQSEGNEEEGYFKHVLEPAPEGSKIFPEGRPLPYEVKQADIEDCYLLSVLVSLAKTNPQAIEACFVQGLDKIETEENIDIRFFRKVQEGDSYVTKSIIITVNKEKIIDLLGMGYNCALWVKLIEKAYSVYRQEGYDLINPESTDLEIGSPIATMFAITGKEANTHIRDLEDVDEKAKPKNVVAMIIRKLKKNKALVCYFKDEFETIDEKSKEKITVYPGHAYTIVGVVHINGTTCIRLINPWKSSGRTKTDKPSGLREGGHIAMKSDDFTEKYKGIIYSTNKT